MTRKENPGENADYQVVVRAARVEEIIDLRHRVLRAGLPRETAHFDGDQLTTTNHFAATIAGKVVGCATIIRSQWDSEPAWQLRGMAVDDAARSLGIGKELLDAIDQFVRNSPTRLMWCNARVPAVGFYLKMRWTVMSEEFEVPTAGPHLKMLKRI